MLGPFSPRLWAILKLLVLTNLSIENITELCITTRSTEVLKERIDTKMDPGQRMSHSPDQYCLPTFGMDYPNLKQPSSPFVQFYRPVDFLTTNGGTSNGHDGTEKTITATLQNGDLWKEYMQVGNEMMVTIPGRS